MCVYVFFAGHFAWGLALTQVNICLDDTEFSFTSYVENAEECFVQRVKDKYRML